MSVVIHIYESVIGEETRVKHFEHVENEERFDQNHENDSESKERMVASKIKSVFDKPLNSNDYPKDVDEEQFMFF